MKAPAGEYVPRTATRLQFGNVEICPDERVLRVDGEPAKLGPRAFDVLIALVERRDRVVGKNELFDLLWPGVVVEENNLQVQVSALRKLLGPRVISTVPGRGYRFTQTPDTSALPLSALQSVADPARDAIAELPLFGREDDLCALRLLVDAHRLVTVVGAGGIGKTALAQALAHAAPARFDNGICVVELAPVSDPALVATAVASALQVSLGNQQPLEAIGLAVGPRHMLILLDNCEHMLQAVAELIDALLVVAPRVHWLVTSQEPLRLAGEQVFRLGALALPAEESVDAARRAGALALFEARAQLADPRFALNLKTSPPQSASAAIWMASPWPSNWPPRACRCSVSRGSAAASGSACAY